MSIQRITSYSVPVEAQWPQSRTCFSFEPGAAALLVHDLQQYFLDFYDKSAEPIASLRANVQRLLSAFRATGGLVVYTGQPGMQSVEERGLLSRMWGPGIVAAPHRSEIDPALAPQATDLMLTKHRYSAFEKTELEAVLRGAQCRQLVVCGVYAHIGCLATALDAFMKDFEVFFVADAVADFSRPHHELALSHIASCAGTVVSCAEVTEPLERLKDQAQPVSYQTRSSAVTEEGCG